MIQETYNVRVRPGFPDGVCDCGIMLPHELQVLVPGFLSVGLDNTARYQIVLQLAIVQSRVDVILRIVESFQGTIGAGRNETRDGVGDGGGERITGVLVCVVMVLGEEDELLPGTFRLHNALFKKELTEARLVPGLKGGIFQVLERLLSVVVLFVSPCGVGPPILGHEALKVFLRVVIGFWDVDLVLLEPVLKLFRIPLDIFYVDTS